MAKEVEVFSSELLRNLWKCFFHNALVLFTLLFFENTNHQRISKVYVACCCLRIKKSDINPSHLLKK